MYVVTGHDSTTARRCGRTDRETTCRDNTALWVASRGKNCFKRDNNDWGNK